MAYVLQTQNLTKKYKQTYAVNAVDLNIKQGEIYGLVGKNGAGKTSIMKMLAGLAVPTEGTIRLFESEDLNRERMRVGSLIEMPAFFEDLTAEKNLALLGLVLPEHLGLDTKAILRLVGLENTGKKKAKHFSLGMKQRLGLAMALMGAPDFLILDEPINGLDPVGIKEFRELLLKLKEESGMTILISSHILGELFQLATRFGIVSDGRLVKELDSEELDWEVSEKQDKEAYFVELMEGGA